MSYKYSTDDDMEEEGRGREKRLSEEKQESSERFRGRAGEASCDSWQFGLVNT